MGQVTVTLNGRSYRLSCGDGEEDRLFQLAEHVRQRIDDLSYQFRSSGDERLLVMAALMITDELWDTKAQLAAIEARLAGQDWDAPHTPATGKETGKDAKHRDDAAGQDTPDVPTNTTIDAGPDADPGLADTEPMPPLKPEAKSRLVAETSLKRALDRGAGPQVSLSQRLAAAQSPRKSGA